MAGEVMRSNENDVNGFLCNVKELIRTSQYTLVNRRDGLNNIAEYGLTIQDVKDAILSLDYTRYFSGPDEDYNRSGEYVWVFKKCIDGVVYYIKLQIPSLRQILIIISFHPDR